MNEKKPVTIDAYLKEIAVDAKNITDVISQVAERLSVSKSTVNRWRAADSVPRADEVVAIVIAINRNRPDGKKCTLKDVAILCNYKNSYRKRKSNE